MIIIKHFTDNFGKFVEKLILSDSFYHNFVFNRFLYFS